ncbi:MAG: ECF subfamily RNA polymerase sigma-24 subunit [Parcubacteria group bacterium GW2011_GWA1_38_7]|nr:MAG: ECF subfamily RNA polymerase sigma-24 subunit [Parcubacteria group bacterium GW2011_GWA1_38_7]
MHRLVIGDGGRDNSFRRQNKIYIVCFMGWERKKIPPETSQHMDLEKQKNLFKEIYGKEADRIFRFVLLRISKKDEALDITGDVFLKLWQTMYNDKQIDNPRAFLFAITRNKIIDWYRKKKAVSLDQMLESEDGDGKFIPQIRDPDSHIKIMASAEAKEVIAVFKNLNPQDAEIMILRFVDGLRPQEIAEELGVSSNSISIRITRLILKLREEFKIDITDNE